jgi:SAM-dependent methyltransferase
MPEIAPATACRSCGSSRVRPFLSLGETPLADALVPERALEEPEPRFPLDVAFCEDCALVQILHEVPPKTLFVDNYLYFSSFSDYVLGHAREHAHNLVETRHLGAGSLVVELASNDGYLLRNFLERGVPVLGIDPAPTQSDAAEAAGVPTLREFFDAGLARKLVAEGRHADVIIANNVMAHVPALNSFVEGMAILLADDGLITIENPYVRDLIDHLEFDTIYHEHLCYYSCTSVDALVRRHGMFLNDVEYFPNLHGGTLRWHVGKREQVSARVREYLQAEQQAGMAAFPYYAGFSEAVGRVRRDLRALLADLKATGHSIAAYGAAAKGSTLTNFVGIGTDLLDFVVDRNVHKQGLYMPGTHIPIVGPEQLMARRPDCVLLLAWNFEHEIVRQQEEYLERGGRFIVPVPEPRVVGLEAAVAG